MSAVTPILPPRPHNENARLAALHHLNILDTPTDADFDFLTEMAAEICGTPYAFVTFVDKDRVWVKSWFGSEVHEASRDGDYCSWAILEHVLLEIPDLQTDERTAKMPITAVSGFHMYAGANLVTSDGFRIGTLCVLDTFSRGLSAKQRRLLMNLAHQVMALVDLRAKQQQLKSALTQMAHLAHTDELTGLSNRRHWFEHLGHELERSKRYSAPLSVIMLDIDHFKAINDRFGHAAGDRVLSNIGRLLHQQMRGSDLAGRYGGEELCVMLPNTSAEGAFAAANHLRNRIAELTHQVGEHVLTITASLGVAAAPEHSDYDVTALLQAADLALYRAKEEGRNRVALAALLS